jgi:hypothetical protein
MYSVLIPENLEEAFQRSGITHVLAILRFGNRSKTLARCGVGGSSGGKAQFADSLALPDDLL